MASSGEMGQAFYKVAVMIGLSESEPDVVLAKLTAMLAGYAKSARDSRDLILSLQEKVNTFEDVRNSMLELLRR